ncbi:MAG: DUF4004 family protein [Candidatus Bipolaricaulaceae bacterium]
MAGELIAKKDVLRLCGISYGQLYRWKRKGLIPESWFVRRSTQTGQETFFPKDKILERIDQIQQLKEERSLDELARLLAPEATPTGARCDAPTELSAIGEDAKELLWKDGGYTFAELVALAVGAAAVRKGIRQREARLLVDVVRGHPEVLKDPTGVVVVLAEKAVGGEGFSLRLGLGAMGRAPLRFDPDCRARAQIDLESAVEQVKLSLGEGG